MLTMLASRCVELLDAAQAGILLVDPAGHLRVMAASSDQISVLELFQVQNEQGPCVDSFRTGRVVTHDDLRRDAPWSRFAPECLAAGFPSVCAVPMRLRTVILGCLNLFMSEPGPLSVADVDLAQALADIATIAVIQDQAARDAAARETHLQHALDSRVVIEQAKGMLAERGNLDMSSAFDRLRRHARSHQRRLTDVAADLVAGRISPASVLATAPLT
ncbi:MAG: GAF and ANTAR domain-containing protein [Pseudolysinimonas sp.]